MAFELDGAAELPQSLGSWFWERRDELDCAVVIELADDEAILRLDTDPPFDGVMPDTWTSCYVYVDIEGTALCATITHAASRQPKPTFADFRAALRLDRADARRESERRERDLADLRRFKQTAVSAITIITVVLTMGIIMYMLG